MSNAAAISHVWSREIVRAYIDGDCADLIVNSTRKERTMSNYPPGVSEREIARQFDGGFCRQCTCAISEDDYEHSPYCEPCAHDLALVDDFDRDNEITWKDRGK